MKAILDKLIELGMSEEDATALTNTEKEKYTSIDDYNTLKAEIEVYKTNSNTLNDTIKNLEKEAGLSETLKLQIEDYKNKVADKDKQIEKIKYDAKLEVALNNANARSTKALRAMLDLDKVVMDENGNLNGLDEQITALRESDDYLFATERPGGLGGGKTTPRTKTVTKNPFSREYFNITEQCRLIKENPVLAEQLRNLAQ